MDDVGVSLLRPGATCWRVERAGRVAFLVDGEAFFGAVADALENARESVWLVGWDFHSSVRLRRESASDRPAELVPLLEASVRRHSSLHVRVLAWDFARLYALEREFVPLFQFGTRTHRRIHFAMDSAHPIAASHHQKLVVVDDSIAFVGGFDLTANRWDTRAHLPDDPRRVTPSGNPYPPFHDVQIAVDGEAASALAALARTRWQRATGRSVEPTRMDRGDPWPAGLEPDIEDVPVGISRTQPRYESQPETREVEQLYRESIAAARRWIYIENQYLTSPHIAGWLAERLREADGPEIVIVGPRENSGWLEENTMGALRDRVVRELRGADRGDRLRVLHPDLPGLREGQMLNVHAKVMVVDDTFARVGSSNLSNRSLGFDTECDIALEAGGREPVREAIAAFRNDLLAEHLATAPARVAAELERTGSLIRTLDALSGGERTLRPIELDASDWTAEAVEALGAIDPEHPLPVDELVTRFRDEGESATRRLPSRSTLVASLAVLATLTLAWQVAPPLEWLTADRLAELIAFLRESWYGPLAGVALFSLASLLLVPITALTVAAGLALGPVVGVAVAWLGGVVAAALGHLAGRVLWREWVRRLAGRRLNALSQRLAERGILAAALLQIVPVAPFTIGNFVAGASHVRLRDFVIGTALGLLPGTVLLVVAADRVKTVVLEPSTSGWLWAAVSLVALVGIIAALRHFAPRSRRSETSA